MDEAKEFGNVERAAKAEEEIDALGAELSRGVGLGGRRRAGSAAERARQRAKKGIKTAINKIGRNDPALGKMLARVDQDRNPSAATVLIQNFQLSGSLR